MIKKSVCRKEKKLEHSISLWGWVSNLQWFEDYNFPFIFKIRVARKQLSW